MCYDPLTLPFVLLIHPITFVHKGVMHSKGCPMDSFNVAFGPTCPFLVFVHKGLMESTMDSFNTAFSPTCPFLLFVPKGLTESKVCPKNHLTLPLVLLVHPITFVPKGLIDSKVCPMDAFNVTLVVLVHPFPLSIRD